MVKIHKPKRTIRAKSSIVRAVPKETMKKSHEPISPVMNSRRTKTPLRYDEFGNAPDLVLTERDLMALKPMWKQHGGKPFKRGNVDSGILNRAIRKGILRLASGEANSERAQIQFVHKP